MRSSAWFAFAVMAASILVAVSRAHASDTLRCGNDLVMEGDSRDSVRALCGKPTDIAYQTILRRPSYIRNGRVIYFGSESVEVRVEIWTYNLGPNRFMRRLRFVDGILEEIETLGYGHNESSDTKANDR